MALPILTFNGVFLLEGLKIHENLGPSEFEEFLPFKDILRSRWKVHNEVQEARPYFAPSVHLIFCINKNMSSVSAVNMVPYEVQDFT
jgi:hypothetical protein